MYNHINYRPDLSEDEQNKLVQLLEEAENRPWNVFESRIILGGMLSAIIFAIGIAWITHPVRIVNKNYERCYQQQHDSRRNQMQEI